MNDRIELEEALQSKQEKLEEIESELDEVTEKMDNFEIDPYDFEDRYQDMINDCYGDVNLGGMSWSADYVLRELDPTMYKCGLLDYVDSIDKEDVEKYKELMEEQEELEKSKEKIEEEIEEIEQEL
jgi:predicted nuclease with TOPRIM domain